jgi:hypothetical protein
MTSIFKTSDIFTAYDCTLQFRHKVLGGIPKDPKVIENWLRSRAGIDSDQEIRQAMLRTLIELGVDVSPDMTYEEMVTASGELAAIKQTNGFKRNEHGLFIEDRQIKAMIKESTAILFPYQSGYKWGRTGKAPRNFLAETVFVDPAQISLSKREPDGIELMMIHASGPKGQVNSLSYHEYVMKPELSFQVLVARDEIKNDDWPQIWVHAQENGFGASRSQSYGRFDVVKWDRVGTTSKKKAAKKQVVS